MGCAPSKTTVVDRHHTPLLKSPPSPSLSIRSTRSNHSTRSADSGITGSSVSPPDVSPDSSREDLQKKDDSSECDQQGRQLGLTPPPSSHHFSRSPPPPPELDCGPWEPIHTGQEHVLTTYDYSKPLQLLPIILPARGTRQAMGQDTKAKEWGFESPTHKENTICFDKETEILIQTTNIRLRNITCNLVANPSGQDHSRFVLLSRKNDGVFSVKVTPMLPGKYDLELFGRKDDDPESDFEPLITYELECRSTFEDVQPYPNHIGVWGVLPDVKNYGFDADIYQADVIKTSEGAAVLRFRALEEVDASFWVEHTTEDIDMSDFVQGVNQNGYFDIHIWCPEVGYYKLILFAKYKRLARPVHDHVGEFLLVCDQAYGQIR